MQTILNVRFQENRSNTKAVHAVEWWNNKNARVRRRLRHSKDVINQTFSKSGWKCREHILLRQQSLNAWVCSCLRDVTFGIFSRHAWSLSATVTEIMIMSSVDSGWRGFDRRWQIAMEEPISSKAWALSVVPHFSLSPLRVAFSRVGWFSRALAFRSLYYPWGKMGTTRSLCICMNLRSELTTNFHSVHRPSYGSHTVRISDSSWQNW